MHSFLQPPPTLISVERIDSRKSRASRQSSLTSVEGGGESKEAGESLRDPRIENELSDQLLAAEDNGAR